MAAGHHFGTFGFKVLSLGFMLWVMCFASNKLRSLFWGSLHQGLCWGPDFVHPVLGTTMWPFFKSLLRKDLTLNPR